MNSLDPFNAEQLVSALGFPDDSEEPMEISEATEQLNALLIAADLSQDWEGRVYYLEPPVLELVDADDLKENDRAAWENLAWSTVAWVDGLEHIVPAARIEYLHQRLEQILDLREGGNQNELRLALGLILEHQGDFSIGSLAQLAALVEVAPLLDGEVALEISRREDWSKEDMSVLADDISALMQESQLDPAMHNALAAAAASYLSEAASPLIMQMDPSSSLDTFLVECVFRLVMRSAESRMSSLLASWPHLVTAARTFSGITP